MTIFYRFMLWCSELELALAEAQPTRNPTVVTKCNSDIRRWELALFQESVKMTGQYILDGHTAVPCEDIREWAKWYETGNRRVRQDEFGDIRISTVFLGLDHSWNGGPPLLFETMVFGGKLDQEMDRYSTWDEADAGHNKMIERVVEALVHD